MHHEYSLRTTSRCSSALSVDWTLSAFRIDMIMWVSSCWCRQSNTRSFPAIILHWEGNAVACEIVCLGCSGWFLLAWVTPLCGHTPGTLWNRNGGDSGQTKERFWIWFSHGPLPDSVLSVRAGWQEPRGGSHLGVKERQLYTEPLLPFLFIVSP